jgi:hypothetical protein
MQRLIAFPILTIFLVSCWNLYGPRPYKSPEKVWGYKPVFSVDSSLLLVKAMGPQPVNHPAKIYVKGNLIFQNDLGFGIHVIDNSNPSSPQRIGFIQLRGNSEMSIKGNYLYANSFTDLVVIDINDWQNPTEIRRILNAFYHGNSVNAPYNFIPLPEHNVYYECGYYNYHDKIQTGWTRDSIYQQCYNP